jgi:hypothetical protein
MAGAKQWRLKCEHIEDAARDRTMHSEVSKANADKWSDEQRTPKQRIRNSQRRVGEKRLKRLLNEYDGNVLVCNSCKRIKVLTDDGLETVHSGDPWFSNRVGEWLIDIESLTDETRGLRGTGD